MNSPYCGKFKVTQGFNLTRHDGLDLVGIDSKEIHSTVNGVIHFAGWENPNNHSQGFGRYVCVKGDDGLYYYFGHLSEIKVKSGDPVKITDIIGIEGTTGNSTGNHCHYEIRRTFMKNSPDNVVNVCTASGIPNNPGGVYDDGYRPPETKKPVKVTLYFEDKKYSGLLEEI